MGGIFINYRSDDDSFAAALVDHRLRAVFGDDNVFRDSRSLEPATEFPPELWRRLKQSAVLLVLIGPRWLTLTDKSGSRRLDDPDDFVRREIRRALKRHIAVLPVLLNQAKLPPAEELPADIADLRIRQYLQLRVRYADTDLNQLVSALARMVPTRPGYVAEAGAPPAPAPAGDHRRTELKIKGDRVRIDGPVTGGDFNGVNRG